VRPIPAATRWSPRWPVLPVAGPKHRVPVQQCRPLSSTRFRFLDARRSLARSAAGTSPDALTLLLAVFSLRSRRCSCRRRVHCPPSNQRPGITSRWPILRWPSLAGFGWPPRQRISSKQIAYSVLCTSTETDIESSSILPTVMRTPSNEPIQYAPF